MIRLEIRKCKNCGDSIVRSTFREGLWVHRLTSQARCFLKAEPSGEAPRFESIREIDAQSMKQQHAFTGERRL